MYLLTFSQQYCFLESYEEAKELEKQYSKHRDSNSFREAQLVKQNKRDHPVNSNESCSNLIDVTCMLSKIDQTTGKGNFIKNKTTLILSTKICSYRCNRKYSFN